MEYGRGSYVGIFESTQIWFLSSGSHYNAYKINSLLMKVLNLGTMELMEDMTSEVKSILGFNMIDHARWTQISMQNTLTNSGLIPNGACLCCRS